jgi:uncharacterized protein RhaS with RHS repeats
MRPFSFGRSHQNYYRDYDPAVGRDTESDPLGLTAGINTYGYAGEDPVSRWDPRGLCDNNDCVPRAIVVHWICAMLAANDFNLQRAANAAYNMREAQNGANDNPVRREGENWLTAAAFDHWDDPQAYVMNIYLWQYLKKLPGSKEPYSQDALNAGLDGHKHANSNESDLKKWCKDCGK